MTKSSEVIFPHYFNYQAKCSNQLYNDGCWMREAKTHEERDVSGGDSTHFHQIWRKTGISSEKRPNSEGWRWVEVMLAATFTHETIRKLPLSKWGRGQADSDFEDWK